MKCPNCEASFKHKYQPKKNVQGKSCVYNCVICPSCKSYVVIGQNGVEFGQGIAQGILKEELKGGN